MPIGLTKTIGVALPSQLGSDIPTSNDHSLYFYRGSACTNICCHAARDHTVDTAQTPCGRSRVLQVDTIERAAQPLRNKLRTFVTGGWALLQPKGKRLLSLTTSITA